QSLAATCDSNEALDDNTGSVALRHAKMHRQTARILAHKPAAPQIFRSAQLSGSGDYSIRVKPSGLSLPALERWVARANASSNSELCSPPRPHIGCQRAGSKRSD